MTAEAFRAPGQAITADGDKSGRQAAEIEFGNVEKYFLRDGRLVETLRNLNLTIPRGQFVCLIGPSGCGKSTLLNMTAGLFAPSAGSVRFQGAPVTMPNTKVGYITQQDNLLPCGAPPRGTSSSRLRLRGCRGKNAVSVHKR